MVNNQSLGKKILKRLVVSYLDGIIVTHKEIGEWYKKKMNFTKKIIVFPIIRKEDIFLKELSGSEVFARYYFEHYELYGRKIFLYVGRIVAVKNLLRLVDAFEKILNFNKDVRLVIVGGGNLMSELKNRINILGLNKYVIMPGRKEGAALLGWYLISHIFILPSTFEPFGAVVNEALLSGCYVLASEKVGSKCLILPNVNGKLFNPFDIDQIFKLLDSTLKEDLFGCYKDKRSKMFISYNECISQVLDGLKK